ncbi:MAG: hypothetical protein JXD23_08920 [Spirochaetales bacterium]|nr:hypothetical protein [Spirochaetales bacterium]
MDSSTLHTVLLIAGIATAFFGAVTLVPSPRASKKSRLNYRSKCSWAPFSTVLMAATAAGMFILRTLL